MLELSFLVLVVLAGIFWLTRIEEKRSRRRPPLKIEGIWDGAERRTDERLSWTVPVLYGAPKSSKNKTSKSENVSGGGILLVLPEKLAMGTELELEFSLEEDERPFKVIGEVVWRAEILQEGDQRLFRTGFRFRWEKEAERLRKFLYREKKRV